MMTNLHLERLELREIELPLKSPFETSFGRTTRRRILIVRVFDRAGAYGYGECVAPEGPFYNHETVDTAWLITAKYVAPGFINMLSHSEVSLIVDGRSMSEIKQGVTTQIFGEISMGPLNDEMKRHDFVTQGDVKFEIQWTTLAE